MHLVVGLGNPGEQYENTRHNLGFRVIDRLAERNRIRVSRPDSRALVGVGEIRGCPVMLAKPQTFMNLAGDAVQPLMEKHSIPITGLVLAYDELDLPWKTLRIKPRGSAAGHGGVESVIRRLGTEEFTRVRLGIDPGHPVRDGAEFVLASFGRQETKELDEVVGLAAEAVESIIAEGAEKSMTRYNRRAPGAITEEE
ncbi:MAG: aminoacyl-tRNA hydrolase [Acidobacteria bacterium]|nr:aminoacyl-tRNA hydrolase [Acidobacteriota bacterium]